MKNNYKKMIIFELIIMLLLLFNSFINNVLSNYVMIIFLLIVLFIFNKLFVIEKQNKRYVKDIILSITIFFLTFFILYYLFGLVIGFAKTNYYNFDGILKYIIPTIALILIKEFLRFQIILKINNNKKLTILTILLFVLIDITTSIFYKDLTSISDVFYLVALYLLPSIVNNLFLTYLTDKVGYKPSIYYLLIIKLYNYLLPVVPNPSEYIYSVINLFIPIVLYLIIKQKFKKESDEQVISIRDKNNVYSSLILPTIIAIVLVYFTCGEFKYSMVAIASGSMSPEIKKGDAVIIEKLSNKKISELKKGDIIAYKYSDVLIIHRIEKIEIAGDKYYFYTKGDANSDIDEWIVEDNMIVGKINLIIPYLGKPTVWVRSL